MDNPLLAQKSVSLIRCINRIEEKRPASIELLKDNFDLQDIISVNLERAIQISVDIASIVISEKELKTGNTMAEGFRILEKEGFLSAELSGKLQKSIGFRNISVHEYQSIDWEIVFDVIHNHLINFKDFLRAVRELI